jgi:hypothetical protein
MAGHDYKSAKCVPGTQWQVRTFEGSEAAEEQRGGGAEEQRRQIQTGGLGDRDRHSLGKSQQMTGHDYKSAKCVPGTQSGTQSPNQDLI